MNSKISENEFNQQVTVKVSRLAIAAIIFAIAGPMFVLVSFVIDNGFRHQEINIFVILGIMSVFISIIALFLGLISFIKIEISGGRITGLNYAIGAVLIPIFAGLFPMFYSIIFDRKPAYNMVCGSNLSGIGKAMFIYANDYADELPRAGGPSTIWGSQVNYKAATQNSAYNLASNGSGGSATISSSLYLLVKYAEVEPKDFICPKDLKVSEFYPKAIVDRLLKRPRSNRKDLISFWDFGTEPWKHNSYSYHNPYGSNALTTASAPKMAVAADRNPWISSPGWKVKDFNAFDTKGGKSFTNIGNTPCHQDEGQNVLYLDGHVNFDSVSFCGVNKDNIYTSWNGSDIGKGTTPKVGSQPASELDSLLVNDPTQ
jgi:prepilin-type processing-associated H-X9-DG protein